MTIEAAGLILSIIALVFTIVTYVCHERKIKKQSEILNKYHIEKLQKAIIYTDIFRDKTGPYICRFSNNGETSAKRFTVHVPAIEGVYRAVNPTPVNLRPGDKIDIILNLTEAVPDILNIEMEWKDEFKEDNHDTFNAQIR